jgi:hypothetical protein
MAKIKIFLDKDETQREAEDLLFKALNHHNSGNAHSESFEDPAMTDVVNRSQELYTKISQEMMQEIQDTLEQDYLKSHGN